MEIVIVMMATLVTCVNYVPLGTSNKIQIVLVIQICLIRIGFFVLCLVYLDFFIYIKPVHVIKMEHMFVILEQENAIVMLDIMEHYAMNVQKVLLIFPIVQVFFPTKRT